MVHFFKSAVNRTLAALNLRIVRNSSYQRLLHEHNVQQLKLFEILPSLGTPKERFTLINEANLWGNAETVSGSGSSMTFTESMRRNLTRIVKKYQVTSILDLPCGDFHWMQHFLKDHSNIHYIGGDIVEHLIERNKVLFGTDIIEFNSMDLTKDKLPDCQLMITRDCLFHLSYRDIEHFIENFCRSRIKYLLITNHIAEKGFQNGDIITGNHRRLNLFLEPLNFPSECVDRFFDYPAGDIPREMCLFDGESLRRHLIIHSREIKF